MNETLYSRFLKVAALRSPQMGGVEFHIIERNPMQDDSEVSVGSVMMQGGQNVSVYHPPAFVLPFEAAERLMDDLWAAGIRPSDYGESQGALSATRDHLKDMQRIVFRVFERDYQVKQSE